MGDIADMMVDGTLCQSCGVYIDSPNECGVPRMCNDCASEARTATDTGTPAKAERTRIASIDYPEAQRRLAAIDLALIRHSDVHYSVRPATGKWIINLYPSKPRIYTSPSSRKAGAPFIAMVAMRWNLLDIADALVAKAKDGAA